MSYRDLQERLSNLLARRTLNGQTPGGTPPTVPDGRRRQDAPGETLVGGSDKLVDTAAPTHLQTMIDAVAVINEQRDRRAKMGRRAEVRAEVLERDRHLCQFPIHVRLVYGWDYAPFSFPLACDNALEVHEIIPRSVWPDGELVAINCVTLCRVHHDWVSDHPSDAYALGLHQFSWERPK